MPRIISIQLLVNEFGNLARIFSRRPSTQRCRICCWLAARALGLGATLTTFYLQFEKAKAALGLPPGVHSYALLPIGYPMGRFGPVWAGSPYRADRMASMKTDGASLLGICSDLLEFTRRWLIWQERSVSHR
jgi:hypothetical protein